MPLGYQCAMADDADRNANRYIIRFPEGMRDRLKAEAEANKRSLNAEIIARLETTLAPPPPMGSLFGLRDPNQPSPVLAEQIEHNTKKMDELLTEIRRLRSIRPSRTPL